MSDKKLEMSEKKLDNGQLVLRKISQKQRLALGKTLQNGQLVLGKTSGRSQPEQVLLLVISSRVLVLMIGFKEHLRT